MCKRAQISVGTNIQELPHDSAYESKVKELLETRRSSRKSSVRRLVDNSTVDQNVLDAIREISPVLVTGSSGYLGSALVDYLETMGIPTVGVDLVESDTTSSTACVSDWERMSKACNGCESVIHTASLHAPHMRFYEDSVFERVNIEGTRVVLQLAEEYHMKGGVVYSSTTSLMNTDDVRERARKEVVVLRASEDYGQPRNIYGVTKRAAEKLCEEASKVNVAILRCSRFFLEDKIEPSIDSEMEGGNVSANEMLRGTRIALEDLIHAHLVALAKLYKPGSVCGRVLVGPLLLSSISPLLSSMEYVAAAKKSVMYQDLHWRIPAMNTGRLYDSRPCWKCLDIVPEWDFECLCRRWEEAYSKAPEYQKKKSLSRIAIREGLY